MNQLRNYCQGSLCWKVFMTKRCLNFTLVLASHKTWGEDSITQIWFWPFSNDLITIIIPYPASCFCKFRFTNLVECLLVMLTLWYPFPPIWPPSTNQSFGIFIFTLSVVDMHAFESSGQFVLICQKVCFCSCFAAVLRKYLCFLSPLACHTSAAWRSTWGIEGK